MTTTDVQQPDYGRPDYGRPDYGRHQQMQRVELTPEEAKAWQACMRSKSVITPTVVTAAIGYGIFKVTPFRAQAKYAAIVGGVLGLISSRLAIPKICLIEVASMPEHSTLRDRLIEAGYYRPTRERQYHGFQPLDVASNVQSSEESSTEIVFDDYPPMNSYDTYSGLNDTSEVPTSIETDLTEPINMQKKSVSYNELRHRNREDFYKKSKQWYTPHASEKAPVSSETTQQIPTTSRTPMQEKTKYGDVWG